MLGFHISRQSLLISTLVLAGTLALPGHGFGERRTAFNGATRTAISRLPALRRAARDFDHDGLPDVVEKAFGTNPRRADSDRNGIWDGDEQLPMLGMTRLQAYDTGAISYALDAEDGDDDDSDDTRTGRRRSHPVTCREQMIRNCRAPVCPQGRSTNGKCRPMPRPPTPRPTARPSSIPTPRTSLTPRPTMTPASGNFDANGNTTKFGIPAGLIGNKNTGAPIWSGSCSGCHGSEKRNRTFGQIRGSFSIPAMSGIRMTDAQLANLVAYLNRFSP